MLEIEIERVLALTAMEEHEKHNKTEFRTLVNFDWDMKLSTVAN
jgi:hypothetical protein